MVSNWSGHQNRMEGVAKPRFVPSRLPVGPCMINNVLSGADAAGFCALRTAAPDRSPSCEAFKNRMPKPQKRSPAIVLAFYLEI